uniref:Uncharacterized protein n=1 Tax=Arundo donax TaxID=35708 RepID=A0A0A9AVI0_ARUDO
MSPFFSGKLPKTVTLPYELRIR